MFNALHHPFLRRVFPYLLLLACTLAAYGNAFHGGFLFDDDTLIIRNQFLRHWDSLGSLFTSTIMAGGDTATNYYRPLQTLLYLITYQLAGLSPFAFHLINVLLHVANACLMFNFGKKLGFAPLPVFIASLLWALHPVHTEAVTYMSATADTLSAFFILLSLIVMLPDFSTRRIWMALPLMLLALLSKETAICLPLMAMACLYLKSTNRLAIKTYIILWPLVALTVLYSALHFLAPIYGTIPLTNIAAPHAADYGPFATLPEYLRFLLWPVGLHMERTFPIYPSPWHLNILLGMALVGAAAMIILRGANKTQPAVAWGVLWFFAAHIILFSTSGVIYEHWLYVPSIGLFLGGSQAVYAACQSKYSPKQYAPVYLAFAALAATLGWLTFQQNKNWNDAETFATNIIAHGEPSAKAQVIMGNVFFTRNEMDKAAEAYRKAIEISHDKLAEAQHNLGETLLHMPDAHQPESQALEHFNRALEIAPNDYQTLRSLAEYYESHQDSKTASAYRQRAKQAQQDISP